MKQICKHLDQYVGQEAYEAKVSGKFEMLRKLCTTISQKQKRERVLVFTHFKEIAPYLDDFLAEVFGRRGFVLHGRFEDREGKDTGKGAGKKENSL